ncbi:MAG: hypothetical protein ACKO7N_10260 [Candidatus Nitrosotenuis sp.]
MRLIFALLLLVGLLTSSALAQEIKIGDPADQVVSVKISENGDAHVTHTVKKTNSPKQVELLSPDFTNFSIKDDNGTEPTYANTNGKNSGIVLFPTNKDVTIEYDINDIIQENNGLWTLDYLYLADTAFFLPDKVDLFYVNGNLIKLGEKKGFMCHGCQVKLQYELAPTIIKKQVTWEGKTFDVQIITQTKISELTLDQPNKTLSIDVAEPNKYITLIIPRDLLWNPYEVSLNDKLIKKQERVDQDNYVWLHLNPEEKGILKIQGVSVVPEFPLTTVLILSAAMSIVVYTVRFNRH